MISAMQMLIDHLDFLLKDGYKIPVSIRTKAISLRDTIEKDMVDARSESIKTIEFLQNEIEKLTKPVREQNDND